MNRGNGLRCFSYKNCINVRDEKIVVSVYCIVFDHSGKSKKDITVNKGIFKSIENEYGIKINENYLSIKDNLNNEENLNSQESLNSLNSSYYINLNGECELISGYRYYRTENNGFYQTHQITDCHNIGNK